MYPSDVQVAQRLRSIPSHNTHKGRNSYPTLGYYLKSKVNVFLIIVCLLHTSPPLWLLFDLLSAQRPWGKERGKFICVCVCVCVWKEGDDESLSYIPTCLYSLERNQQHLVCKTTSADREHLLCSAGKEQINARDRIWGWLGAYLQCVHKFLSHFCIRMWSVKGISAHMFNLWETLQGALFHQFLGLLHLQPWCASLGLMTD